VFARLAKVLALIAVVQILGGHWMALQSVAWVCMVIDYSQTSSFGVAIENTLDGDHPCSLCEAVAKGRGEEKKKESKKISLKFEAVLMAQVAVPVPMERPWTFVLLNQTASAWAVAPPTPPPLA